MTKLGDQVKLKDVVRFEPYDPKEKKGQSNFVVASEAGVTEADVNQLLSEFATGALSNDLKRDHMLLAAAMVEPIMQAVPYMRWTNAFFTSQNYGPLEDNAIPVEYYVTTAWETGPDSAINYVEPGVGWTRPSFKKWQTGVRIRWSVLERAGWNVLQREMQRAAEQIAKLIDLRAQYVLDTAIDALAGQGSAVAGGLMTKAAVDAVVKAAAGAGFPMTVAVVNSGTQTDMAAWSGGPFGGSNAGQNLPPEETRQLLQTLYFGKYGGMDWYSSPFVPSNFVYFGGPPATIGYEQTRGQGKTASDVDIDNQVDKHIMITPDYAHYVGNALSLRRLRIAA